MTLTVFLALLAVGTALWLVPRFTQTAHRRRAEARAAALMGSLCPGSLVATRGDDGFGVAKILAIDPGAVHIRLYQERFPALERVRLDLPRTLGSFGGGKPFSVGHLPLSPQSFLSWQPVSVGFEPVTEDELEGYRIWQESQGGVFG